MEPPPVLKGRATAEGTAGYAARHKAAAGYFRAAKGLTVSSVGMGSYLGEIDADANRAYEEAASTAIELGVNLFDTAINYRHQQSERDLGRALRRNGRRDEVLVVTKGGFIPLDADVRGDPRGYVQREYVDAGIVRPEEVAQGSHCIAPAYLRDQLGRSLRNLGLESVDFYLVHNAEAQLNAGIGRAEFDRRILAAFEELERQADGGRIHWYGAGTWDGLRAPPEAPNHLSLERLVDLAERAHSAAGGKSRTHRFGAVELPFNIAMVEAFTSPTQEWKGERAALLEAAQDADLLVLASASLLQARLVGRLPPFVRQVLKADNDVEACIEFARSGPGVTAALVGMGDPRHVRANVPPLVQRSPDPEAVLGFFAEAE